MNINKSTATCSDAGGSMGAWNDARLSLQGPTFSPAVCGDTGRRRRGTDSKQVICAL